MRWPSIKWSGADRNLSGRQSLYRNDHSELSGGSAESRSADRRPPAAHAGLVGVAASGVRSIYFSAGIGRSRRRGCSALARRRLELLADIPVLALTGGILKLAETLVADGPIPRKAAGDALHIAVATAYGCEYLLTWNCRHIANAEIQRAGRLVVRRPGFDLPVICTPEELMGAEE